MLLSCHSLNDSTAGSVPEKYFSKIQKAIGGYLALIFGDAPMFEKHYAGDTYV